MNKKILYYIAALLWGAPGGVIAVKGIQAYLTMPTERLWWLLLITAFVLMCFYLMFRKAVNKYSARIAGLPRKTTPCNIEHDPNTSYGGSRNYNNLLKVITYDKP